MPDPRQTDMAVQLSTVDFHGQVLEMVSQGGKPYVPIKPICVNLGVDWEGQRQRILRDSVLYEGACIIKAPSRGGEQDMFCLPLEYLNGFASSGRRIKGATPIIQTPSHCGAGKNSALRFGLLLDIRDPARLCCQNGACVASIVWRKPGVSPARPTYGRPRCQ
jgi:P22_AR N-terminal domain